MIKISRNIYAYLSMHAQLIAAMPLLWLLLTWLDGSTIASREEDLVKTELKRNRAIKMQKNLLEGFRSNNPSGRAEEGNDTLVSIGGGSVKLDLPVLKDHMNPQCHQVTVPALLHRASTPGLAWWSRASNWSLRTWACGCRTRTRWCCRECQVSSQTRWCCRECQVSSQTGRQNKKMPC